MSSHTLFPNVKRTANRSPVFPAIQTDRKTRQTSIVALEKLHNKHITKENPHRPKKNTIIDDLVQHRYRKIGKLDRRRGKSTESPSIGADGNNRHRTSPLSTYLHVLLVCLSVTSSKVPMAIVRLTRDLFVLRALYASVYPPRDFTVRIRLFFVLWFFMGFYACVWSQEGGCYK